MALQAVHKPLVGHRVHIHGLISAARHEELAVLREGDAVDGVLVGVQLRLGAALKGRMDEYLADGLGSAQIPNDELALLGACVRESR